MILAKKIRLKPNDEQVNQLWKSVGTVIKNINKTAKVRKLEKRLHRLQRSVSRKYEQNKEGNRFVKTGNIIKQEKEIRLLYRKLTNIRTNHLEFTLVEC